MLPFNDTKDYSLHSKWKIIFDINTEMATEFHSRFNEVSRAYFEVMIMKDGWSLFYINSGKTVLLCLI